MLPTCITHPHNSDLNWNFKEHSLDAFLFRQSTTDFAWEMQNDALWDKGLHLFRPNWNRVMGYYSVSLHYDKHITGNRTEHLPNCVRPNEKAMITINIYVVKPGWWKRELNCIMLCQNMPQTAHLHQMSTIFTTNVYDTQTIISFAQKSQFVR